MITRLNYDICILKFIAFTKGPISNQSVSCQSLFDPIHWLPVLKFHLCVFCVPVPTALYGAGACIGNRVRQNFKYLSFSDLLDGFAVANGENKRKG